MTRRIRNIALAIFGAAIWILVAHKIMTGLRLMTMPDAVCAGMEVLFGPFLIWELLQRAK